MTEVSCRNNLVLRSKTPANYLNERCASERRTRFTKLMFKWPVVLPVVVLAVAVLPAMRAGPRLRAWRRRFDPARAGGGAPARPLLQLPGLSPRPVRRSDWLA